MNELLSKEINSLDPTEKPAFKNISKFVFSNAVKEIHSPSVRRGKKSKALVVSSKKPKSQIRKRSGKK